jgi:hypothetical protein
MASSARHSTTCDVYATRAALITPRKYVKNKMECLSLLKQIQGDQKVSVHLTITVQKNTQKYSLGWNDM